MNRILLTGAGFSRNWGGWLAEEITNRLLNAINQAPDPITEAYYNGIAAAGGNYETVLQYFQSLYMADPAAQETTLHYIEDGIRKCFIEMDRLYAGKSAGLSNDATYNAEVFLAHFDAIFTTNQDALVERLFANLFSPLIFARTDRPNRWGIGLPGAVGMPTVHLAPDYQREAIYNVPDESFNFRDLEKNILPYIKLHGSYDWQTAVGHRLMISGGNKGQQIAGSPLLKSYLGYFFEAVTKSDTQLVVIGYGFGDAHLNAAIVQARRAGARISLLNPLGAHVTRSKYYNGDPPVQETPKQDVFEALRGGLSVLSQRTLTEIFGDINQAKQLFRDALNVKTV